MSGIQMATYLTNIQSNFARALSNLCAEQNHKTCADTGLCGDLADRINSEIVNDRLARTFDVSIPYVEYNQYEPSQAWPTAALVRNVNDLILNSPRGFDAFRRSVWLTSSIARLGERGFPPSALIRTCVAPSLRRRLTFEISTNWHALKSQKVTEDDIDSSLFPWIEYFSEYYKIDLNVVPIPSLEDVLVLASTGAFGDLIDDWIATTAISHIIDWRFDGAHKVDKISPTDCILPGGLPATHWVFDRFSYTYMSDWRTESLAWEISYAHSPEQTAARAGVDIALLQERPASLTLTLEAIVSRHTTIHGAGEPHIFGGVSINEIILQIVHMLNSGNVKQAQDLTRAVMEQVPYDGEILNIHAFVNIPENPKYSLDLFESSPNGINETIKFINVVSCYLAQGKTDVAAILLRQKNEISNSNTTVDGWFWNPRYLMGERVAAKVQGINSARWIKKTQSIIESTGN